MVVKQTSKLAKPNAKKGKKQSVNTKLVEGSISAMQV